MSPPVNRRKYLLGTGALLGGATITVAENEVVGGRPGVPYDSRRNAGFATDEPVVAGVDVSLDSSTPDSYAALIRTRAEADERYRVDYLQEAYDTDVSQLYTVDYETEFIAVVGHVLPKSKNLDLTGTSYENGTLHTSHRITDSSGVDDLRIHHNLVIFRQQGHDPPEDIVADFTSGETGN